MFCVKCGAANGSGVRFCTTCGEPMGEKTFSTPVMTAEVVREEPERNITGMILGIVSTVCAGLALWFMLLFFIEGDVDAVLGAGIVFGTPGMICSAIGKSKGSEPHKMTKVGFILSICALGTAAVALTIGVIDSMTDSYYYF